MTSTTPIGDAAESATDDPKPSTVTLEEAQAALARIRTDFSDDDGATADLDSLAAYIADSGELESRLVSLQTDLDNAGRELDESRTAIRNHLNAQSARTVDAPAQGVAVPPTPNTGNAPEPVLTELPVGDTDPDPVRDNAGVQFAL